MVKKIIYLVTLFLIFSGAVVHAEKEAVLEKFPSAENWFIPSGTILVAQTQTQIFSFNLEVPVLATLDEPAICPKTNRVVLPKGTTLMGTAGILKSNNRVNVRFYRIILPAPSGREFDIHGIGLWPDGSAGLIGEVTTYKEARLMSSAAAGAMTGVSQVVGTTMGPGQQVMANAVEGAMSTSAQEVYNTRPKVDVSIEVPRFQKCLVFLMNRLALDKGSKNRQSVEPIKTKKKSQFKDIKFQR